MALKENIEYWRISLQNPEPVGDEYYVFDEIIVFDEKLIEKIEKLRELIISYCVVAEKNSETASEIFDEIYDIIISTDKIQYTEFVAFWKTMDVSYSAFKKLQNKKAILEELLKEYCKRRRKLYYALGYSNAIVQALYDSGTSRKKGSSGITKVRDLIKEILGDVEHVKTIDEFQNQKLAYFLPDSGDKELFEEFLKKYEVHYQFGKSNQNKNPDIVLKVDNHLFIIEAKHIKESGGAQDKQIVELINFIKYSENSENVHYVSFMDGIYFNNFIWISSNKNNKVSEQKASIEEYLKKNKNNFFVNTAGITAILEDLKDYK